jgi:hypothetical protein
VIISFYDAGKWKGPAESMGYLASSCLINECYFGNAKELTKHGWINVEIVVRHRIVQALADYSRVFDLKRELT